MSNCSRHENEEAVGFCVNCGELVCAICHKEIDGKGYCTVCADKLFASTEVKSEQTPPPAPAEPTAPSVPSAARPASLRAKKAKTEVAPVVQVAKVVEPVTLAEKPASEPAKPNLVPPGVKQPVSNLWWLLPLLFTWIGGVIAGLLTKGRDSKKALNMFLTGLGMTFVHGIVIIALLAGSVPPPPEQPPTSSTDQTSSVTSAADQQPMASSSNPKTSGTATAGQTQVGQTPVATNGRDIEVTGPSNTQSKPPPPTDYKLTTLSDQAVQPSDKDQTVSYADKLQVTIPGGQLKESQKLVISAVGNPPAPSSHQTQLAVYDISFEKQHEFDKGLTFSFAYDPGLLQQGAEPESLQVSCLDEQLNQWLTVPSEIDDAKHTLTVQTSHNGLWQIIRDTEGQVALLTDHFVIYFTPSDFGSAKLTRWFELDRKARKKNTDKWDSPAEFYEWQKLVLDPDIQNTSSVAGYSGNIPNEDKDLYTYHPTIPKYILDIGYFSEKFLKKYEVFGKEPLYSSITFRTEYKISPDSERLIRIAKGWRTEYREPLRDLDFSTSFLRLPIYMDKNRVNAYYSGVTRSITIGASVANNSLPFFLGHELFHAIQNADYWMGTRQAVGQPANFFDYKDANLWWFESTADYASYKIANGTPEPTNKRMDTSYLGKNLLCNFNTRDFIEGAVANIPVVGINIDLGTDPEDPCSKEHPYQNAWFWDFLVNNYDVNFVNMYKTVIDSWSVRAGVEQYIKNNVASGEEGKEKSLFDAYRDFTVEVLFDKDGPCKDNKLSSEEITLPLSESKHYHFLLRDGILAAYKGVVVKGKGYGGSRKLSIRLSNLILAPTTPEKFTFDIYKLRNNERSIANLEQVETWEPIKEPEKQRTCVFDLAENEALYMVATYDSGDGGTFDLDLEEVHNPSLSIVPPPEISVGGKGTTCTPYTFEAKGTDMPPGVTYTWYIDDVETSSKDTSMTHVFEPGPYRIKVVAKWGQGDTAGQKDARHAFYVGQPKLTVKGPKELKEGEKGTMGDFYTFWVESEYVPSSAIYKWGGQGMIGTVHTFTVRKVTKITETVTASWDVNGCKGTADGRAEWEIANQSIDINASPAIGTKDMPTIFTATGRYIPKGAMFLWELGDERGVGDLTSLKIETPVTHTYTKAGKYSVKVTAYDTDGNTGATKTIQYQVNPAAGVKIISPGATGNINDEYTFIAESSPMPEGARIEWYFEGGKKYRDTDTVKHTFTTAGDKTVMVQWVIGNEVVPICKDQIQFTVVAAPTLSIKMPGDGKVLQPDKENIFYAVSTSIPGDAVYEWYINEAGVLKAQGREGTVATAPAGFFKEGDYEILVIAKWKGADLKEQWAQADARFKVATINISLSIIPPPEIQGKTAKENTKYYFAFNTDVPSTATFTWYRDGQEVGGGETIGLAFASGQHTVGLKATWRDSDAARTPREQKAKDLSFNIGAATTLPTGHGWFLVRQEGYDQNSYTWQLCCGKDYYRIDPYGNKIYGFDTISVLLDKDEGVMFGGSEWCGNKTYTLGWTQFPSFLKPNSDFYCSAALTPPGKGINPNEIHVSLWVDADDYETAELYEKYYSLLGQQKIWIPDGSRAKAPFSDESKLAGKSLTIWISDFGSYTYKYR